MAGLCCYRSHRNNYSPKVMILAGDNPATDTPELIDLSSGGAQLSADCPNYAPCWKQGRRCQKRVEMEASILPKGKVLVDRGSAQDEARPQQACRQKYLRSARRAPAVLQ